MSVLVSLLDLNSSTSQFPRSLERAGVVNAESLPLVVQGIAAAQRARWARTKGKNVVSIASGKRRKMSAAAIARIRVAQKARWAKWRKQRKTA